MGQSRRYDVVVIGGGQAGLAVGYHLAQGQREFAILDAGARVGDAWRTRWEGLRLFTSGRLNSLPGMPDMFLPRMGKSLNLVWLPSLGT